MKINWRVRFANKDFWIALIPALVVFIQTVAAVFGFTIDLGALGNKIIAAINAAFVVLTILGIVNDPTTADMLVDSNRAMEYEIPRNDHIDYSNTESDDE